MTKAILIGIFIAIVSFYFGYNFKKDVTVLRTEIDTITTTISHTDTVPKVFVRVVEGERINIDSLFRVAKDSALKLLKNDSTALHYARYESVTDTTITDSLSSIYVRVSYYSRLPLDPKRSMELEIEKKLFIPTIYYEESLPFYKEKCFLPLVGSSLIIGVLLWAR
jgi:hypothetical protein